MEKYLAFFSIASGLLSAGSWFYGSRVKVSHEDAVRLRVLEAEKRGEKVNYGAVLLDGWDMSATFAAQSKWNSAGALLAACSILAQSIAQALHQG